MKNKIIALSAISASFIAILLTIGAYLEITDVFMLVISSVFVLLPLYYGSFKGSFLAFLAGGVIAFVFSSFNFMSIIFPAYFVFIGLYPIVSAYLREKKNCNICLYYIIGCIWCVLFAYGIYFYYTSIMGIVELDLPKIIADNIWWFVGLFGVIFYFIFDRFTIVTRRITYFYLKKIVK